MAVSSCEGFSCNVDGAVDLIEDEKFDFDVPISPTVCDGSVAKHDLEDEDEVFFGPIGHKERCVTVNSDLHADYKPMSPLNGEQIAELFKEATAVSLFIKSQSLSCNADESKENENGENCITLSKTFTVEEDQNDNCLAEKPDQLNDLSFTKESRSPPETISEYNNSSMPDCSIGLRVPTTPNRVLRESNSQVQPSMPLPSPFKAREARPLANVSKFARSKLPKTQMTLKTRSCFNSPIKAEHVYGIIEPCSDKVQVKSGCNGLSPIKTREPRDSYGQTSNKGDSSFTEPSKLRFSSQSGIKPPGFVVQPRRRRTSSTSSASSLSSALSQSNPDLNETFTILDSSVSDASLIPSACARKVPTTKASLKPLTGSSALSKRGSSVIKPKGKPQPVKALPQSGKVSTKKAPQISRSLGSTPGKQKGNGMSDQTLRKPRTPSEVQRSKSFTTPRKASFTANEHQKGSLNSEQLVDNCRQTPSAVQRSKSFTTPNNAAAKNRSSISVRLTPSKEKDPGLPATPRRRASNKTTPRKSLTTVPTPVRRRGSAVDTCATSKAGPSQAQTRSKALLRPSTPNGGSSEVKAVVTPPNEVPSKVMKRKSLSAGGQKRRSLLPTPMRNNKVTKSQSQKLNSSSKKFGSQGCLPFNISPSSESIVPRIAGGSSDSPVHAKAEVLKSTSSLSDPFSPVPQTISAHPVIDSCASGDSLPTNLIELSPTLPTEGNLIDL